MKTEKDIFIGEIKQHLQNAGHIKKKHFGRRTKYLGIPTSWLAVIIGATFITSAALVGLIWQTYSIQITGPIDINGQEEEAISILYDGVLLEGTSMTITTMDYDVLNPGDEFTVEHVWSNSDGHDFIIDYDLSGMPLEYVDVLDLWYGFEFRVFEHNTQNEITEPFTLGAFDDVIVDYHYDVDGLFAEPIIAFPFNLDIDIEVFSQAIQAFDDSFPIPPGAVYETNYYAFVLVNDIGVGLTITSLTKVSGNDLATALIAPDLHRLVVCYHAGAGAYNNIYDYVITDNLGQTDTGRFTILNT